MLDLCPVVHDEIMATGLTGAVLVEIEVPAAQGLHLTVGHEMRHPVKREPARRGAK